MGAPIEAPARRRRHARLIAAATELIAECATAAGAVFGRIAQAPPGRRDVTVGRWPIAALAAGAPARLEAGRDQDDERWPARAAQEREEGRTTFERRCALAEAENGLLGAEFGDGQVGAVAAVTAPQAAAMGLAGAGADFLDALAEPEGALELLARLTGGGEFTAGEVLDDATDTAIVVACLMLRDAAGEQDPSAAALGCLAAARQLALAVTVASTDDPAHGLAAAA
ncbi:hypothetical protein [Kitasatospora sp. NPDC088346]|uniref:hypothetical protein n=1 Tax=Kitasatospora sp. NPDC088346 TaxID=3364073 RepID=UPI00382A8AC5